MSTSNARNIAPPLRTDTAEGMIFVTPGMYPEHNAILGAVWEGMSAVRKYVGRHESKAPEVIESEDIANPSVAFVKEILESEPVVGRDSESGDVRFNLTAARLGLVTLERALSTLQADQKLRQELDDGAETAELIEIHLARHGDAGITRKTAASEVLTAISRAESIGDSEAVIDKIGKAYTSQHLLTRAMAALYSGPSGVIDVPLGQSAGKDSFGEPPLPGLPQSSR